jgi:hypothetical protein
MPKDNAIKFGILKCRDLVQLYYGARMVASLVENNPGIGATAVTVIAPDPRRIRYEVILANNDPANHIQFQIGSYGSINAGTAQIYNVEPGASLTIERDFFTDLDAVCLALEATVSAGSGVLCTRETFLTPIPVDETP